MTKVEVRVDILKYNSNNIKRIGQFKNELKHGQWVAFFENGTVSWIGNFKEGVEFGIWKDWYKSGSLKEECYYKNGIKEPINFWNKEGEQTLENGTGYTIESYGANDHDVFYHHYENGIFVSEERVEGVSFGSFTPNSQSLDNS